MSPQNDDMTLRMLLKGSGIDFFTRRTLQRWERGEISTDTVVDLLQAHETARVIRAWRARLST
jgi:hypothetical protein